MFTQDYRLTLLQSFDETPRVDTYQLNWIHLHKRCLALTDQKAMMVNTQVLYASYVKKMLFKPSSDILTVSFS